MGRGWGAEADSGMRVGGLDPRLFWWWEQDRSRKHCPGPSAQDAGPKYRKGCGTARLQGSPGEMEAPSAPKPVHGASSCPQSSETGNKPAAFQLVSRGYAVGHYPARRGNQRSRQAASRLSPRWQSAKGRDTDRTP